MNSKLNQAVMPRLLLSILIATLSLGVLMPVSVFADDGNKTAILDRMKQRFPQLLTAQKSGQIGEAWSGYVAVPPQAAKVSDAVRKLVTDENNDRKALYAILAKELEVSVSTVASNNRTRLYKKAASGVWLQKPDGTWVQK